MSITLFSPGRPGKFNRIFGIYRQEEVGKYGLEVPHKIVNVDLWRSLVSAKPLLHKPVTLLVKFLHHMYTGFVRVLENLESPGILLWHFPGLESPGKKPLVLERSGNLSNSTKKYKVYGMQ